MVDESLYKLSIKSESAKWFSTKKRGAFLTKSVSVGETFEIKALDKIKDNKFRLADNLIKLFTAISYKF